MKKIILVPIMIVLLSISVFAAERDRPLFLFDTNSLGYSCFDYSSSTDPSSPDNYFRYGLGFTQDISLYNPDTELAFGINLGVEKSVMALVYGAPVYFSLSWKSFFRMGAGWFIPFDPSFPELQYKPEGMINEYYIALDGKLIETNGYKFGLYLMIKAMHYEYTDTTDVNPQKTGVDSLAFGAGISFSIARTKNPLNRAAFPEYTHSWDFEWND